LKLIVAELSGIEGSCHEHEVGSGHLGEVQEQQDAQVDSVGGFINMPGVLVVKLV
jgi:hypothetical protein